MTWLAEPLKLMKSRPRGRRRDVLAEIGLLAAPDGESLGSQPGGDLVQIGGSGAEALGVGFGRQPVVEVRRGGILLLGQQLFEGGLLGGRWPEHERDIAEFEVGRDGSQIVLGPRLGRNAAPDGHRIAGFNRGSDAVLLGRQYDREQAGEEDGAETRTEYHDLLYRREQNGVHYQKVYR